MSLQSVKWYIYERMGDALEDGDTSLWRWYQDADIFLKGIK